MPRRPERAALLAACLERPPDEAARQVYADWLEENGDERDRQRAEFIRLQLRLAPLDEDDPRRDELEPRGRAARRQPRRVGHRPARLGAAPRRVPPRIPRTAPMHRPQFLKGGAALRRAAPVREVVFDNPGAASSLSAPPSCWTASRALTFRTAIGATEKRSRPSSPRRTLSKRDG